MIARVVPWMNVSARRQELGALEAGVLGGERQRVEHPLDRVVGTVEALYMRKRAVGLDDQIGEGAAGIAGEAHRTVHPSVVVVAGFA